MPTRKTSILAGVSIALLLQGFTPDDAEIMTPANDDAQAANGRSFEPDLSANGRFVAFISDATNLIDMPFQGDLADVFVRDRHTGAIELVSISLSGGAGTGNSYAPAI